MNSCYFAKNSFNTNHLIHIQKSEKVWAKVLIAVDVESKYLYNGFPYLGKDFTRSGDVSLPTDVIMKLIAPLFKKRCNVTCNDYFTSLDLTYRLAMQHCCLVGTINQNRREVLVVLKKIRLFHDSVVLKSREAATMTITAYQCKRSKYCASSALCTIVWQFHSRKTPNKSLK